MHYGDRLKASFHQYWSNKSLLAVLLLEFVARTILIAFFIAVNIAILMSINKVDYLLSGMPDIHSFMNARSYIVLAVLLLIQFVVILYVNSFFSAGFFGMLKNVVQDGSTTFDEFLPSAKRYWYATFRYLVIPYVIMLLALLPFTYFYGVASVVASFGGMFDTSILNYLGISLLFALLVTLIVLYWFSYGPAIIVFDDADAWDAMKESFLLARRKAKATFAMVATCIAILVITLLFVYGVNLGIALLSLRYTWLVPALSIIELLLNILIISASVIAAVFIFLTYEDLTVRKEARHMQTKRSTHKIKRKS